MNMHLINGLVKDIHHQLSTPNKHPSFAELAKSVLQEHKLHESLSVKDLLLELSQQPHCHLQNNHPSKYVIPIYFDSIFNISLHVWVDSIASPHDHNWSGAFQIISGQGIQSILDFTQDEALNAGVCLGKLTLDTIQLLQAGDTQALEADTIHSICHTTKPTFSLCIRSSLYHRRFNNFYWPGGLKLADEDHHRNSDYLAKYLLSLNTIDAALFLDTLKKVFHSSDLTTQILLTIKLSQWVDNPQEFIHCVMTHCPFKAHQQSIVDALNAMLTHHQLVALRRQCSDLKQRLLLALLYNRVNLKQLLTTWPMAHPTHRHDTQKQLIDDVANSVIQLLSTPSYPNSPQSILGFQLLSAEQTPLLLRLVQSLITYRKSEPVINHLMQEFDPSIDIFLPDIKRLIDGLQRDNILRALFT